MKKTVKKPLAVLCIIGAVMALAIISFPYVKAYIDVNAHFWVHNVTGYFEQAAEEIYKSDSAIKKVEVTYIRSRSDSISFNIKTDWEKDKYNPKSSNINSIKNVIEGNMEEIIKNHEDLKENMQDIENLNEIDLFIEEDGYFGEKTSASFEYKLSDGSWVTNHSTYGR